MKLFLRPWRLCLILPRSRSRFPFINASQPHWLEVRLAPFQGLPRWWGYVMQWKHDPTAKVKP